MDPSILESMTSLGMIQKISTGYTLLDLALCALLPVALQYGRPYVKQIWSWLTTDPDKARFTRHIKFVKREGYYHYDPSERNHMLQEAVLMYVGSREDLVSKFPEGDIKVFKTAAPRVSHTTSSACSEESYQGSNADLNSLSLRTAPAECSWIEVEPGVLLKRTESQEDRGRDGSQRDLHVTFTIISNHPDGAARIQTFVDRCFQHYRDAKTEKRDDSRYLFMPFTHSPAAADPDASEGSKNTMVYKRYKLSDEKTFSVFFHHEKTALLHLVDHFLNKTGKFAIPGYPHKLGLLLYGPPGTGKTSLIKALAHHTNRSIVSVPLPKVKTNQELMDIMYDQAFLVHGEDLPMRLPHSKVIFVMEDIDAAGSIVLRRGSATANPSSPPCLQQHALQQHHLPHLSNVPQESSPFLRDGAQASAVAVGPLELQSKWKSSGDDLNLAGVLNALDGVVDCPNRILIMTSNHPDALDPALIRPGRINKRIYLGPMTPSDAERMAAHHFPSASTSDLSDLCTAASGLRLVPAHLEAMCAEHDSLPTLTAHLRDNAREIEAMINGDCPSAPLPSPKHGKDLEECSPRRDTCLAPCSPELGTDESILENTEEESSDVNGEDSVEGM